MEGSWQIFNGTIPNDTCCYFIILNKITYVFFCSIHAEKFSTRQCISVSFVRPPQKQEPEDDPAWVETHRSLRQTDF